MSAAASSAAGASTASSSASTNGSAAAAPAYGFLASTHAQQWMWSSREQMQRLRAKSQNTPRRRIDRQKRLAQRHAEAAAAAAAAAAAPAADANMVPSSPARAAASADSSAPMLLSSPAAAAPAPAAAAPTAAAAPAPAPKAKKEKDATQMEALTLDEERQLRLHYSIQLTQMASILDLPVHVTHTAIIFFKRFYLHQSVMEYSPKEVAYCCIYVACKAEEHHLPLDRMISKITNQATKEKGAAAAASSAAADSAAAAAARPSASAIQAALHSSVSTVLSLEVPVLSVLLFHLRLYHLSRALRGLVKELETFDTTACALAMWINAGEPMLTQQTSNEVKTAGPGTSLQSLASFFAGSRAPALAQLALLSDDLIFLHSPAQIALAILAQMEDEARQFAVAAKLDTSANSSSSSSAAPAQAASPQSLDLIARFIASKAPATAAPPSIPSAPSAANSSPLQRMQSRIKEIRQLMEEARIQSTSIDKKALKAIEKKRKQVSNPLLDPASKLYQQAKEASALEKEEKRMLKKKKQREEQQLLQDSLLMDSPKKQRDASSSPLEAGDSGGGFIIRKRLKSEHNTPAAAASSSSSTAAEASAASAGGLTSPRLSLRGANLAQQFADMEQ